MIMDRIDTERKARKPHRCSLCGCTIEVGTKYIRQFVPQYKFADNMHKECQELLGYEGFYDDNNEGTDEGYFKGCISDYVWQHHQHDDDSLDEGLDAPICEQVKLILKELEV